MPACLWTPKCAHPSSVHMLPKQPNPGSGLGRGLPESIQDAVKLEFQINNEELFSIKHVLNISWDIFILKNLLYLKFKFNWSACICLLHLATPPGTLVRKLEA